MTHNEQPEIPEMVSVPEAAKRAGVARNTMLLAAKNGNIKAIKPGRHYLIFVEDIARWKEEHYQPDQARRYPPTEESESSESAEDKEDRTDTES